MVFENFRLSSYCYITNYSIDQAALADIVMLIYKKIHVRWLKHELKKIFSLSA